MTTVPEFWIDRAALLDGDIGALAIRALTRSGELQRLRRGRYAFGDSWDNADEHERHRIRVLELGDALGGRAAISHDSAALLHGIDLPGGVIQRVHVTWPASPGRRTTTNIRPHRGRVEPAHLQTIDGVLVTSAARTVFDIACSASLERAISAADSALHQDLCTAAELADLLTVSKRVPGAFRARRILEFSDGLAESVGESICRLRMAQLGLPAPTLQAVIPDLVEGPSVRVDFEFESLRTVTEFDGRTKYGRLLEPGQTAGDAVFAEKVREDRIRDTGRQCVRVIWADLSRPQAMLTRFRAAFTRAGFPDWRPDAPRFRPAARPV